MLWLSDFTYATDLGVHIAGTRFEHLLYQFALAYSGWRHVAVVLGGECFLDLSAGLQDALWELGGSPHEHRTDSLSAAFRNLAEREDLTRRYEWLCAHYGMVPSRNNRGASHENGSIEARHGTLKRFVDQALLLRGNREFDTLEAYRHFLAEVTARANGRITKALAVELAKRSITVNCVAPGLIETDLAQEHAPVEEILKAIPAQRMGTVDEVAAVVSFLLSAGAAYVTRQVIAVNGGLC